MNNVEIFHLILADKSEGFLAGNAETGHYRPDQSSHQCPACSEAAFASGGGSDSSKTWMTLALSTATRRPEGEMATLPPASSAGAAGASSATLPLAASNTLTSWPFTSSLSSGE